MSAFLFIFFFHIFIVISFVLKTILRILFELQLNSGGRGLARANAFVSSARGFGPRDADDEKDSPPEVA